MWCYGDSFVPRNKLLMSGREKNFLLNAILSVYQKYFWFSTVAGLKILTNFNSYYLGKNTLSNLANIIFFLTLLYNHRNARNLLNLNKCNHILNFSLVISGDSFIKFCSPYSFILIHVMTTEDAEVLQQQGSRGTHRNSLI